MTSVMPVLRSAASSALLIMAPNMLKTLSCQRGGTLLFILLWIMNFLQSMVQVFLNASALIR